MYLKQSSGTDKLRHVRKFQRSYVIYDLWQLHSSWSDPWKLVSVWKHPFISIASGAGVGPGSGFAGVCGSALKQINYMKNVRYSLSHTKITAVRLQHYSAILWSMGVHYHGSQLPASIVVFAIRGSYVKWDAECKKCSEHIWTSATQLFTQII
jgi:hypothetical protein